MNNYLWGESWIGLDSLHSLTSQYSYKLKIILTDFEDPKKYVAVYDQFQVTKLSRIFLRTAFRNIPFFVGV